MIKNILTGALAAAAFLVVDWAVAAPLSLSHNMYSRGDQMGQVERQTEQGTETPTQFRRQIVAYNGSEAPGTIIIDTPNTFLYLVQPGGRAIRYGIGVGRDGFRWSGVQSITKKAEWPDWHPPAEMIARQPYLPRFMAGGPPTRSARAPCISATRSIASTAPTPRRRSASACRPAASASPTRTSLISPAASTSAPR